MEISRTMDKLLSTSTGRDKTLKVIQDISKLIRYFFLYKGTTLDSKFSSIICLFANNSRQYWGFT